jgi:hypothetical protein
MSSTLALRGAREQEGINRTLYPQLNVRSVVALFDRRINARALLGNHAVSREGYDSKFLRCRDVKVVSETSPLTPNRKTARPHRKH